MNFLAHALLAGDDPALIVGGVVGDWIKGPLPGPLPADLARGVALHRAIDSFAETQVSFRASRARISAPRRRYAGILVDIFYDHLLARNWASLHTVRLEVYTSKVYALVAKRYPDLPASAPPALRMMANQDWLASYRHIDSIATTLTRMSRRARQPNPLHGSEAELLAEIDGFAADFEAWLAEARVFTVAWRSALNRPPGPR